MMPFGYFILCYNSKQDRQCTYNIMLRPFSENIFAVEKQENIKYFDCEYVLFD